MKAISLRQPWPWALLNGGCKILSWPTKALVTYRGPLLIHSATRVFPVDRYVRNLATGPVPSWDTPGVVASALGGFVGIVTVADTHHSEDCQGICSLWAHDGGFHTEVTAPVVFPKKIPGYGKPRLFDPAPLVLRMIGGGA